MLVGYARVSTQDQNPELQIDALKAAGCERIFSEHISRRTDQRPQLSAVLEFVRSGDTLVVWKLDRLAGSLKQLIDTMENLKKREINFRSLNEAIDSTTTGGKLIFHIFGALSEFELGVIRDRTLAGLEAARARGRVGGRPPALSEEKLVAARSFIRDGQLTIVEIAEHLDVSDSTIYKYFPSPRTLQTQLPS
jgi:DNA invertase Pin-like site-specific DNA recombinase